MAGPLSGIAGQQQIPLASSLQGNQQQNNVGVRENDESQPEDNQIQPQGVAPAETQQSETDNLNLSGQEESPLSVNLNELENSEARRGSVVDITV